MSEIPDRSSEPPSAPPSRGCPLRELYGDAFDADPKGHYERWRQAGPVVPVKLTPDGTFWGWLVMGYHDLLKVLRDPDGSFTNNSRVWRAPREGPITYHPVVQQMAYRPNALFAEGPDHARLRAPITAALDGLDRRRTRQYVASVADETLQAFAADGRADLVADYAARLPLQVIMGLLGVGDHHAPQIAAQVTNLLQEGALSHDASKHLDQLIADLVAERYASPGPDLISSMIAHGPEVTAEEMTHQVYLMLVAGLGGCIAWITNTVLELLTNRDLYGRTMQGLYTFADVANQVMWRDPPVQNTFDRFATRDCVVGGARIREGDLVIPSLAAANAEVIGQSNGPERFMSNEAHLAWSAGAHQCPAKDVSEDIVHTAVETLFRRLESLRLSVGEEGLAPAPALVIRTMTSLPVEFTPGRERPVGAASGGPRPTPFGPSDRAATEPRSAGHSSAGEAAPPARWYALRKLFRRK